MNQKSFHPSNKENQRKMWIAQQKATESKKREEENRAQFEKEQQHFKNKKYIESGREEKEKLKAQFSVGFMYQPPPGYKKENEIKKEEDEENQLLPQPPPGEQFKKGEHMDQKFDFLKNAPVEGQYTGSIRVTHKPFGIELRDVRCARCGQWGHTSGDRECKMFHLNPNDPFRQKVEDPLSLICARENTLKSNNLVLKSQFRVDYEQTNTKFIDEQSLLTNTEGGDDEDERELLAKLTPEEKKILLKKLRKMEKKEKKVEKKQKKEKQKRRHTESDSSDSESSSDDSKHKHGHHKSKKSKQKEDSKNEGHHHHHHDKKSNKHKR